MFGTAGEVHMLRLAKPMVLAALLAPPLVAQQSTPPDSTVRDSLPPANPHDWRILPGFAGLFTALVVAPPALFLMPGLLTPDSTRALPDRYVAAYFMGGGIGEDAPSSWTHSENLDVLRGHLYASLSVEHFYHRERVQYQTIRVGYLFRPNRGVTGGVTVGYRQVSGNGGEDAVLIGLPITGGGQVATLRFEPIYAISRAGVSWTYRVQAEIYLLPKPLFTGVVIEAKPLRQGGPYQGTLGLLFGVRR